MTSRLFIAIVFLLAAVGATGPAVAAESAECAELAPGGVATLYALDSETSHMSLNDGRSGTVVQGHLTYNRDSQLSFDTYAKNGFQVGIQGGEEGAIVDLGDDTALKGRYGYTETVGNAQGFTSIHLESGRAVIVKDYKARTFQPLVEFGELEREREDGDSAAVVLGHMYLIRISGEDAATLYAKVKVLSYVPGEYVTIRWSRL
jgi:hypothetical protein